MTDDTRSLPSGVNTNQRGRAARDKIPELKSGHAKLGSRERPFKDDLFSFIDTNLRWIRYGVYGIGVVGVVIIVRATRSTQKFRQISDIPESYISRNLTLQGTVENVGPDCCLHVKHKPVLSLPSPLASWRTVNSEASLLPVHLAGIEPSPVGRKWLVEEVKGQHVWFRLLERTHYPLRLDCLVTKKNRFLFNTVLNEELIRRGLCRLKDFPTLPSSPRYNHVIDRLVAVEARAERKKISRIRRVSQTIKNVFVSVVSAPKQIKTLLSKFRRR